MLTPPKNTVEARVWIKMAVEAGDYRIANIHGNKRMTERRVTIDDIKAVLLRAPLVEAYTRQPQHGGSVWRASGRDLNNRRLAVGVETYVANDGRMVVVCTVFVEKKQGR